MRAVALSVNEIAFAKAICEAMGVNPEAVTSMTITIKPSEPLVVVYEMLADETVSTITLPTIGQEERETLLDTVRQRAEKIA